MKRRPFRLLSVLVGPAPTAHGARTTAGGDAPRSADNMLAEATAQDCKEESPRQNSSMPVTMMRGSAQLLEAPMEKGLAFRMELEVPGVKPF